MKHRHRGGPGREFSHSQHSDQDAGDERHPHRRGRHAGLREGGGRHGRRLFDYGELRLLVLAMIAEEPRHGYELMRAIEERMGGSYSPSPGVIYPTLSWIEDMGYAVVETEDSGRKRYRVTPEGEASIAANKPAIDALFARIGMAGKGRREGVPAPIIRAMENLKLALRLRLRNGPVDQADAARIAEAIDEAAQKVERSA
ncbi:PadR family transcriptional regulator [Pseudorhodoplanes sinuspersici]|uniref:PadR family transcriptional regulator n=1 Tax=Pseudorhodoplanes sinuspersici TaxID=1235591 RepID=A0A1W6ZYP2_9HYPH|nr:PadR family transcriptional regulator [Pseudorhodoplanes sinuspersici]ARQ02529.1 PadR family transcriptional regulator [Pseudorhodoplanes sinuspersici]RKE74375.1 PadR family transcriptional regulator [Pseudorhodoplanes sinuspersici]